MGGGRPAARSLKKFFFDLDGKRPFSRPLKYGRMKASRRSGQDYLADFEWEAQAQQRAATPSDMMGPHTSRHCMMPGVESRWANEHRALPRYENRLEDRHEIVRVRYCNGRAAMKFRRVRAPVVRKTVVLPPDYETLLRIPPGSKRLNPFIEEDSSNEDQFEAFHMQNTAPKVDTMPSSPINGQERGFPGFYQADLFRENNYIPSWPHMQFDHSSYSHTEYCRSMYNSVYTNGLRSVEGTGYAGAWQSPVSYIPEYASVQPNEYMAASNMDYSVQLNPPFTGPNIDNSYQGFGNHYDAGVSDQLDFTNISNYTSSWSLGEDNVAGPQDTQYPYFTSFENTMIENYNGGAVYYDTFPSASSTSYATDTSDANWRMSNNFLGSPDSSMLNTETDGEAYFNCESYSLPLLDLQAQQEDEPSCEKPEDALSISGDFDELVAVNSQECIVSNADGFYFCKIHKQHLRQKVHEASPINVNLIQEELQNQEEALAEDPENQDTATNEEINYEEPSTQLCGHEIHETICEEAAAEQSATENVPVSDNNALVRSNSNGLVYQRGQFGLVHQGNLYRGPQHHGAYPRSFFCHGLSDFCANYYGFYHNRPAYHSGSYQRSASYNHILSGPLHGFRQVPIYDGSSFIDGRWIAGSLHRIINFESPHQDDDSDDDLYTVTLNGETFYVGIYFHCLPDDN